MVFPFTLKGFFLHKFGVLHFCIYFFMTIHLYGTIHIYGTIHVYGTIYTYGYYSSYANNHYQGVVSEQ